MTTAQTVARHDGAFHFGTATLRTTGTMRCGTLRTAAGEYHLEPTDRRRLGVVARADGRPVVTLGPAGARVPGSGGDTARWVLGRHWGTLTRGDARIEVRAGWPGQALQVEVEEAWTELELVVLTTCFAVLTRRRQRLLTAVAIAGATGGPH